MEIGDIVVMRTNGLFFSVPHGSLGIFMGWTSESQIVATVQWLNGLGILNVHKDYIKKFEKKLDK